MTPLPEASLRERFEAWYEVHGNGSSYYPQKAAYEAGHAAARAEAETLLQQVAQIPHVREVLMWDKHKALLAQIDDYLKRDAAIDAARKSNG